jgi:hypothetical protein
MTAAETEEAIEIVRHWIVDLFAELMTPEGNHKLIRETIKSGLGQGRTEFSNAVDAARAGDVYADHALRELGAEMLYGGEELPQELKLYLAEALLQSPLPYPRGRNDLANKGRDSVLATCVQMAMDRWGLKHSRNDATVRPSASTLVATAFNRSGYAPRHEITERQVERIYIENQKDARKLAAKMSATNPRFEAYDEPHKIV